MGDIADGMFDDLENGVFSGDLCDHCGDAIEWCECDPENGIFPPGVTRNSALRLLLTMKP